MATDNEIRDFHPRPESEEDKYDLPPKLFTIANENKLAIPRNAIAPKIRPACRLRVIEMNPQTPITKRIKVDTEKERYECYLSVNY